MTIDEKILAIWTADATATALVPASRFKVPGNWEDLARPYVIQYPISEKAFHAHNNSGAIQTLRIWEIYQLSVIADSYSSALAIAEKIRTVFNGNFSGVQFFYLGQRWIGQDQVVGTEHIAVEFKIAETLTA